MRFATGVFVVLAVAYLARILGALLHDEAPTPGSGRTPRTKVRELVDALVWPLTMFTSKAKRGYDLSALRVMAITAEYFVLANLPSEWNSWAVAALLGPPALLILEPLFAMIPIKEMSLAAAAYLGQQIAKRVTRTEEVVETPMISPPDNPVEEPGDGNPNPGK